MSLSFRMALVMQLRKGGFGVEIEFVATSYAATNAPVLKEMEAAQRGAPSFVSSEILDTIDLSEFSVTIPLEDFLPQSHKIDTKKHFKSSKELAAYLLMLYEKIDNLEPNQGPKFVKMEDQNRLHKLKNEFDELTISLVI